MSIQNVITQFTQPDFDHSQYIEGLKKELLVSCSKEKSLYSYNTWSRIARIAYDIFSIIFFPLGIVRMLHRLAVRELLPSSLSCTVEIARKNRNIFFEKLVKDKTFLAKSFSVLVNGKKIQAMIFGKKENFKNGRWMLFANPNGHIYEQFLGERYEWTKRSLEVFNSNCLFYNYPGTGDRRKEWTSRNGMVSAHLAMRRLLEDKEKGAAATEIIEFAVSMGGGVVQESLSNREIKRINNLKTQENLIKRVFIFHQTFSNLCFVPAHLKRLSSFIRAISNPLIRIFGWNIGHNSSLKLEYPSIIVQTATKELPTTREEILHDEVIGAKSALAYKILKKGIIDTNRIILGTFEKHVDESDALLLRLREEVFKFLQNQ
jgi:Chlamydia CHLPS protein (DUF818)